jgi:DUF1680 family protein
LFPRKLLFLILALHLVACCGMGASKLAMRQTGATVVSKPPVDRRNDFYISNREPLAPSAFVKLPIGNITPEGWLKHMLELDANGMTGNLQEVSKRVVEDDNAWFSPDGLGKRYASFWESPMYWLRSLTNLGYTLDDPQVIEKANRWIENMFASQMDNGYFGPRENIKKVKSFHQARPDLWPNMLAVNVMQAYYEATSDQRVIDFLLRYFRWQLELPDEEFLGKYWQNTRAVENLDSIYWLYNRTGKSWLLTLAKRTHEKADDWTTGIPNHGPAFPDWHGVNLAQCFKEPAVYYAQAKDRKFIAASYKNYKTLMNMFGQVPGGMYCADERVRKGFTDPRQASETCAMVEFMHSAQTLAKVTGDPTWADRCENVAFNSFPVTQTADHKAIHYLTAPNLVQLDSVSKHPTFANGKSTVSYSPYEEYFCCQHNHGIGWPFFAQHLWLATADNGLCALMYSPSKVDAKVGDGTIASITQKTNYPFESDIVFTISLATDVEFPLYLRIPSWCDTASVFVNDRKLKFTLRPSAYIQIHRKWKDGDIVKLSLPMEIKVKTWTKNNDFVSIDRGPLTYSLQIGEDWKRYGGTDKWPKHEVYPTNSWNYGLDLDSLEDITSFEVLQKKGRIASQPFTLETAPVEIKAKARKIPAWKIENGAAGRLQPSPAKTQTPLETVTLIPMGCARLRISAFPTTVVDDRGHSWDEPADILFSHDGTAHVVDTPYALNDGRVAKNSSDAHLCWFSWYDRKGSEQWVSYKFNSPKEFSKVKVYWLDETSKKKDKARWKLPQSWQIVYKDGNAFKPVKNLAEYSTELNKFSVINFKPIKSREVRLRLQLQQGASAAISEWVLE